MGNLSGGHARDQRLPARPAADTPRSRGGDGHHHAIGRARYRRHPGSWPLREAGDTTALGDPTPPATVTADDIEQFKAGLLAENLTPATVNRHLALLKTVFYLAIRNKKAASTPMRGVKLFRENNARVRYLTEEEEFRLFQQLPARYHPIVRIGLLTGLRASNLLGLRWRDVDLEAKVYMVPLSKSGEALRLPMHSQVQEILKGLPRNGADVFAETDGKPPRDFTHTFTKAARSAGIQDLHFHDLRHTWASRMAMAGVDLLTIKELGGWKTIQMVQRYAHLSPDHKRQAIERLKPQNWLDVRQSTLVVPD